jgi:hypothetical protein
MIKFIFLYIILTLPTLTYGQCDGCDSMDTKLTTQKIIGKWLGEEIPDCKEENKLVTDTCRDKLFINEDFTYSWAKPQNKNNIRGKWSVSSFSNSDKNGKDRYFEYECASSNWPGRFEISKLTTDTLILRYYSEFDRSLDILGVRAVDIFFLRSK